MLNSGYNSGYIGGEKGRFARLHHLDSKLSQSSDSDGVKKYGFSIQAPNCATNVVDTPSNSSERGMRKGSEGIRSIGRSISFDDSQAVFPEDRKVSKRKIFDPQDKSLQSWNKIFVISCILAIFVDPLFFYIPVISSSSNCLDIDQRLAVAAITSRTIIDGFYLIRILFQFLTAYVAPSSRVFGCGELVIDRAQIARRYLRNSFIIDFLAVLPLPQIVILRFLFGPKSSVIATKQALTYIIILQYIPRVLRKIPLTSELKRTSGVFAETAWSGAVYYLLLYMLASHVVGAVWYLMSLERTDACWEKACSGSGVCNTNFLYCGNEKMEGYAAWSIISNPILSSNCSAGGTNFNFGIFEAALSSGIVSSQNFVSKYFYCLWWGLQNLSTLGQGLQTSTFPGEVLFSIGLAISGLILFALLIGNMQTYLQSLTIRLEEMRIKRHDSEQWMHHRMLPQELRERVRRYDRYRWLETRGVDEYSLARSLPKDLRRDIKRHLCLALVTRVPLFENMDERLLDAICERLKPSLFTESTFIVREGDPVDEMLFIIRGRLVSETTDGGRSGFFNRSSLQEGDFCGEELLTWALDPKSGSNLPSSTRTVKATTEVEAFALEAEELKFVAGQFRRLHSRQVQHAFRYYSHHWRTWAARFIQAAWRHYSMQKAMKLCRKEEADLASEALNGGGDGLHSLGATLLVSKFAANALRGVHRSRIPRSTVYLVKLPKPPEPDFTADDAD